MVNDASNVNGDNTVNGSALTRSRDAYRAENSSACTTPDIIMYEHERYSSSLEITSCCSYDCCDDVAKIDDHEKTVINSNDRNIIRTATDDEDEDDYDVQRDGSCNDNILLGSGDKGVKRGGVGGGRYSAAITRRNILVDVTWRRGKVGDRVNREYQRF